MSRHKLLLAVLLGHEFIMSLNSIHYRLRVQLGSSCRLQHVVVMAAARESSLQYMACRLDHIFAQKHLLELVLDLTDLQGILLIAHFLKVLD